MEDRHQFVDSLYGPGTVRAWLLTLCTVFTSCTLNKRTQCNDTISIDFIGALLLPLVAASHLIFQIAHLPLPVAEVVTSTRLEVQKTASALEALLNIYETFLLMALLCRVSRPP